MPEGALAEGFPLAVARERRPVGAPAHAVEPLAEEMGLNHVEWYVTLDAEEARLSRPELAPEHQRRDGRDREHDDSADHEQGDTGVPGIRRRYQPGTN